MTRYRIELELQLEDDDVAEELALRVAALTPTGTSSRVQAWREVDAPWRTSVLVHVYGRTARRAIGGNSART